MTKNAAVLYHADNDGFGAAYAAWTALQDTAHYIPVQYGQPVPEIPEGVEELFIVDFCYDADTCSDLQERYATVILDHHKTAAPVIEQLCHSFYCATKSGAVMAWEFFSPDVAVPAILQYVQDYDLWQFKLPYSKDVNLAISSLPWEFEAWAEARLDGLMCAGAAIKSFQDGQIKKDMRNVRMMELNCSEGTFEVPVVNTSQNISEVGHELCARHPNAPFSISYVDRNDVRTWALRSEGEFDVSEVAQSLGGGGHKNAAGFTTAIGWPGFISTDFSKGFEEGSE